MICLKKSLLFITSVLLIAMGSVAAHPPAKSAASELAALQAVDQEWLHAYNAGDVNKLTSLYAKDAVLLPPRAPAAHGRSAIHVFFAQDVAASQKAGVTFHLGAHPDGGVVGEWGWCSGTYSVTDKSGKVVDVGKYLSVSRKEAGAWHYVRDTWNSDGAMAASAGNTEL
ncbi:MAG TPA: nuclear transport factor 2 family protein [Gammaproteobacteria bacterium]|nr:nuclear transport factor 2 family protein [Gammaproteobacteria bacterium]